LAGQGGSKAWSLVPSDLENDGDGRPRRKAGTAAKLQRLGPDAVIAMLWA
jgi:hypothetical protein